MRLVETYFEKMSQKGLKYKKRSKQNQNKLLLTLKIVYTINQMHTFILEQKKKQIPLKSELK